MKENFSNRVAYSSNAIHLRSRRCNVEDKVLKIYYS